jgi:hypothetical protein
MTNPTKILLALLTLAMMTGAASAQQRTFYDGSGKVSGRTATYSAGRSRTTIPEVGLSPARRRPGIRGRSMMRADGMSAGSPRARSASLAALGSARDGRAVLAGFLGGGVDEG